MTHRSRCGAGLGLLLALSCLPGARAADTSPPPGLTISNAWFARAPSGETVGFFTIDNKGGQAVQIIDWRSPDCRRLTFDEAGDTATAKGDFKLTVPPKNKMAFVRGGYHLSCQQPGAGVAVGKTIQVTATFHSGRILTTPFEIRAPY